MALFGIVWRSISFFSFIYPVTIFTTLSYTPHTLSATVIAIVALYASINEGYLIWKGRIR